MADTFIKRGYKIVSGGTDNHLFLVDLIGKNITGKEAEHLLDTINITVNKNSVPNDPASPFITSGLRIGSPAMTTRGFKEPEAVKIADWICDLLDAPMDAAKLVSIKAEVLKLCQAFPVYA